MHWYVAYELIITSELLLPELCSIDESMENQQADLSISLGHARRDNLSHGGIQGLCYHIQPEVCWLKIPNVACFLIKQGRQIIVEPFPGADEDSVRLFLYTTCLPLVLISHNFFLLHGGAIHWGEHGVAFLANFGQGKSTLLASFLKQDYRFLSDDICVLNQEGFILPGFPYLQLREDVIKKLDLDIDQTTLKLIRPTLQKWYIPVHQSFHSQRSLLKIAYIINSANRADLLLMPLVGLRKIHYLKKYTYHPLFVKGLGKDLLYFHQCAALAARTSVISVERARQGFQWDDYANSIEQDLRSQELECQ